MLRAWLNPMKETGPNVSPKLLHATRSSETRVEDDDHFLLQSVHDHPIRERQQVHVSVGIVGAENFA
jgi:hypothetical protein